MRVLKSYINQKKAKIINQKALGDLFSMNSVQIFLLYQKIEKELKEKKVQKNL